MTKLNVHSDAMESYIILKISEISDLENKLMETGAWGRDKLGDWN